MKPEAESMGMLEARLECIESPEQSRRQGAGGCRSKPEKESGAQFMSARDVYSCLRAESCGGKVLCASRGKHKELI